MATLSPEEISALQDELTLRQGQANARRNEPGFAENVAALDARIAEIEALLAA